MLLFRGQGARFCDGINRREFLGVGGLGIAGLTLAGLSQARAGMRGDFKPIATNVSGTRICEHLPRLARMADRYAILRSVTHTGTNHGTSAYHMLTGHIHFSPGTLRHPSPSDYPSVGCAV